MNTNAVIMLLQELDQLDQLKMRLVALEGDDTIGVVVAGGPQVDLPANSLAGGLTIAASNKVVEIQRQLALHGVILDPPRA